VSKQIVVVNFAKYHPASREITSSARGNGKLKWIRLDTDWDDDPDIAVLPWAEQALWPWLLSKAGKGHPVGTVDMNAEEISRMTTLKVSQIRHALTHLRRKGRVTNATARVTTS
jgi:hypothetical protein